MLKIRKQKTNELNEKDANAFNVLLSDANMGFFLFSIYLKTVVPRIFNNNRNRNFYRIKMDHNRSVSDAVSRTVYTCMCFFRWTIAFFKWWSSHHHHRGKVFVIISSFAPFLWSSSTSQFNFYVWYQALASNHFHFSIRQANLANADAHKVLNSRIMNATLMYKFHNSLSIWTGLKLGNSRQGK